MLTVGGRWVLAIAVVTLAAGITGRYPSLTAVGVGLLAVLLLGSITLIRRPDLTADQLLNPSTVAAGEAGTSVITITNRGARSSPASLVSNQVGGDRLIIRVPPIPGNSTRTEQLRLPALRRGVLDVGPVAIGRSDPLGLFWTDTYRGASRRLVVHPAVETIAPLPTGHRRELEGAVSTEPIEGGISFHSLRDYREGDDLRLVHWRSVAKTRQMMVRKNVIATEPRLMVVLDTALASYDTSEVFEDAVAVAASLVTAGARSRYPLSLRTTGGRGADVAPGGKGLTEAMRVLAEITPGEADHGLNRVVLLADRAAGVSLGVVTGSPSPEHLLGVSHVRPRFDMVTVIQIGERAVGHPLRVPGANVVPGRSREEVYARWKARFG